jgi:CubicO group peptidase (beta-lactamase class C family)
MPRRVASTEAMFARFAGSVQPGCAVGVIRGGELIHAAGYGFADMEQGTRIDADTVFNIASTSKQFTAFALMLLAREGELSLDDSVRRYVPELPAYADIVSLRQLMHHTGGLRSYIELLLLGGRTFAERTTREDALAVIARQRGFDDVPGHAFAYSNTGYFLLSVVVERVSGRTLAEFSQANIFFPLGMTSTSIVDRYPADIAQLARGYLVSQAGASIGESAWEQTGDGQVHTSVRDLALWDANFYVPRVGDRTIIDEMQRSGVLHDGHAVGYGAGLFLSTRSGLVTVSHGGGWAGYRSELLRFPERRLSVIVLSNRDDVDACALAQKVAQIELELPEAAQTHPLPHLVALCGSDARRPVRAGTYRGEFGQYIRILARGEAHAIAWGGGEHALMQRDDGLLQFTAGGDAFLAVTHAAPDGRLHVSVQLGEEVADFMAVGTWTTDVAHYAGRYVSDECDGHMNLNVEGDHLAADLLGKVRALRAGAEGELVTDEGIVLRVQPLSETDTFTFASWGLRGLQYRRASAPPKR